MTPVRLEPAALPSRVKHATTDALCSPDDDDDDDDDNDDGGGDGCDDDDVLNLSLLMQESNLALANLLNVGIFSKKQVEITLTCYF